MVIIIPIVVSAHELRAKNLDLNQHLKTFAEGSTPKTNNKQRRITVIKLIDPIEMYINVAKILLEKWKHGQTLPDNVKLCVDLFSIQYKVDNTEPQIEIHVKKNQNCQHYSLTTNVRLCACLSL